MLVTRSFLSKLSAATQLRFDEAELDLMASIQDQTQREQFEGDLKLVVSLWENAQAHDGTLTVEDNERWDKVSKRIAAWSSLADLARPEKSGWFGKADIPVPKRMMLKGLLSPSCALVASGMLD